MRSARATGRSRSWFARERKDDPLSPRPLRIGYWPFEDAPNGYAARMREMLGAFGEVRPFSERVRLTELRSALTAPRAYDVVFVNWLENKLVDAAGRPSYAGACKLFLQTLLFRLRARKLVFVRHNRYPHAAPPEHAPRMRRWLDLYERLFDATITHSETEQTERRAYCPHPLYPVTQAPAVALPEPLRIAPGYFVVFGRIERYKRIEALIATFPASQRLVVAGAVGDPAYARELSLLGRHNVLIAPGFLGEPEAQELVRRAAGVVLSHADDDMVVSGSFFYALSHGRPVLALETPFIRWARALLDDTLVVSAGDLDQLCALIAGWKPHDDALEPRLAVAREAFGERSVREHLARILNLPVPPVMPREKVRGEARAAAH